MKEQEDLKNEIGEIMREITEMIEVPEEGMITEEGMEIGMRIEVTAGLRIGRREIEEVQVLGFAGRKEETEMMSVGEMMLKEVKDEAKIGMTGEKGGEWVVGGEELQG